MQRNLESKQIGTNLNNKNITQRAVRQDHWNYVNTVLNTSLEKGKNKPFWNYIQSKRTDNIGVSGIKSGSIFHRDNKANANILNQQYKLVFTKEKKTDDLKWSTHIKKICNRLFYPWLYQKKFIKL